MRDDGALAFPDAPRDGLDRVLGELVELANDVLTTQGRLRALLRANQAVVQQLDLPIVLQRIVDVAVELVGAQYGALGIIAPQGGLDEFIHSGMPDDVVAAIGRLPQGLGLLGALIDEPQPIRIRDISGDPRSVGFPDRHPPMRSFLGVPVRVRDEVYGNLYLTNRSTGEFTPEDEELVTALAATAGFAIDNARLFAETKRRQAWSAASAEITAALLSDDSGDSVALLAARVLTLSEADIVFVLLPEEDEAGQLTISTARGRDAERWEGRRFAMAGTVAGRVLEARQPRLIEEGGDSVVVFDDQYRFGPTMAVPLLASGRALGVLIVSRPLGAHRFTEADLEMAADFAGQASVAMELATARADRQLVLLLEDRGRIARDLHDHVIQQLFATGLELQSVVGTLPPGPNADRVERAITNLDLAISQIRTAVFALSGTRGRRPETIRHRLIDIVNELGVGFAQTPHLSFAGPVDLVINGSLADEVVAVVREALSNVARHAAAEHVSLNVSVTGADISIEVTDDGIGFTEPQQSSGLGNLGERARRLGGHFSIRSADGHTVLAWSAPYSTPQEGAKK